MPNVEEGGGEEEGKAKTKEKGDASPRKHQRRHSASRRGSSRGDKYKHDDRPRRDARSIPQDLIKYSTKHELQVLESPRSLEDHCNFIDLVKQQASHKSDEIPTHFKDLLRTHREFLIYSIPSPGRNSNDAYLMNCYDIRHLYEFIKAQVADQLGLQSFDDLALEGEGRLQALDRTTLDQLLIPNPAFFYRNSLTSTKEKKFLSVVQLWHIEEWYTKAMQLEHFITSSSNENMTSRMVSEYSHLLLPVKARHTLASLYRGPKSTLSWVWDKLIDSPQMRSYIRIFAQVVQVGVVVCTWGMVKNFILMNHHVGPEMHAKLEGLSQRVMELLLRLFTSVLIQLFTEFFGWITEGDTQEARALLPKEKSVARVQSQSQSRSRASSSSSPSAASRPPAPIQEQREKISLAGVATFTSPSYAEKLYKYLKPIFKLMGSAALTYGAYQLLQNDIFKSNPLAMSIVQVSQGVLNNILGTKALPSSLFVNPLDMQNNWVEFAMFAVNSMDFTMVCGFLDGVLGGLIKGGMSPSIRTKCHSLMKMINAARDYYNIYELVMGMGSDIRAFIEVEQGLATGEYQKQAAVDTTLYMLNHPTTWVPSLKAPQLDVLNQGVKATGEAVEQQADLLRGQVAETLRAEHPQWSDKDLEKLARMSPEQLRDKFKDDPDTLLSVLAYQTLDTRSKGFDTTARQVKQVQEQSTNQFTTLMLSDMATQASREVLTPTDVQVVVGDMLKQYQFYLQVMDNRPVDPATDVRMVVMREQMEAMMGPDRLFLNAAQQKLAQTTTPASSATTLEQTRKNMVAQLKEDYRKKFGRAPPPSVVDQLDALPIQMSRYSPQANTMSRPITLSGRIAQIQQLALQEFEGRAIYMAGEGSATQQQLVDAYTSLCRELGTTPSADVTQRLKNMVKGGGGGGWKSSQAPLVQSLQNRMSLMLNEIHDQYKKLVEQAFVMGNSAAEQDHVVQDLTARYERLLGRLAPDNMALQMQSKQDLQGFVQQLRRSGVAAAGTKKAPSSSSSHPVLTPSATLKEDVQQQLSSGSGSAEQLRSVFERFGKSRLNEASHDQLSQVQASVEDEFKAAAKHMRLDARTTAEELQKLKQSLATDVAQYQQDTAQGRKTQGQLLKEFQRELDTVRRSTTSTSSSPDSSHIIERISKAYLRVVDENVNRFLELSDAANSRDFTQALQQERQRLDRQIRVDFAHLSPTEMQKVLQANAAKVDAYLEAHGVRKVPGQNGQQYDITYSTLKGHAWHKERQQLLQSSENGSGTSNGRASRDLEQLQEQYRILQVKADHDTQLLNKYKQLSEALVALAEKTSQSIQHVQDAATSGTSRHASSLSDTQPLVDQVQSLFSEIGQQDPTAFSREQRDQFVREMAGRNPVHFVQALNNMVRGKIDATFSQVMGDLTDVMQTQLQQGDVSKVGKAVDGFIRSTMQLDLLARVHSKAGGSASLTSTLVEDLGKRLTENIQIMKENGQEITPAQYGALMLFSNREQLMRMAQDEKSSTSWINTGVRFVTGDSKTHWENLATSFEQLIDSFRPKDLGGSGETGVVDILNRPMRVIKSFWEQDGGAKGEKSLSNNDLWAYSVVSTLLPEDQLKTINARDFVLKMTHLWRTPLFTQNNANDILVKHVSTFVQQNPQFKDVVAANPDKFPQAATLSTLQSLSRGSWKSSAWQFLGQGVSDSQAKALAQKYQQVLKQVEVECGKLTEANYNRALNQLKSVVGHEYDTAIYTMMNTMSEAVHTTEAGQWDAGKLLQRAMLRTAAYYKEFTTKGDENPYKFTQSTVLRLDPGVLKGEYAERFGSEGKISLPKFEDLFARATSMDKDEVINSLYDFARSDKSVSDMAINAAGWLGEKAVDAGSVVGDIAQSSISSVISYTFNTACLGLPWLAWKLLTMNWADIAFKFGMFCFAAIILHNVYLPVGGKKWHFPFISHLLPKMKAPENPWYIETTTRDLYFPISKLFVRVHSEDEIRRSKAEFCARVAVYYDRIKEAVEQEKGGDIDHDRAKILYQKLIAQCNNLDIPRLERGDTKDDFNALESLYKHANKALGSTSLFRWSDDTIANERVQKISSLLSQRDAVMQKDFEFVAQEARKEGNYSFGIVPGKPSWITRARRFRDWLNPMYRKDEEYAARNSVLEDMTKDSIEVTHPESSSEPVDTRVETLSFEVSHILQQLRQKHDSNTLEDAFRRGTAFYKRVIKELTNSTLAHENALKYKNAAINLSRKLCSAFTQVKEKNNNMGGWFNALFVPFMWFGYTFSCPDDPRTKTFDAFISHMKQITEKFKESRKDPNVAFYDWKNDLQTEIWQDYILYAYLLMNSKDLLTQAQLTEIKQEFNVRRNMFLPGNTAYNFDTGENEGEHRPDFDTSLIKTLLADFEEPPAAPKSTGAGKGSPGSSVGTAQPSSHTSPAPKPAPGTAARGAGSA